MALDEAEAAELDALLVGPPDLTYRTDPIGWMVTVLGIPRWAIHWSLNAEYKRHQWDGTKDPLAAICTAIALGEDVGVESGTGTGKTFLAAAIALWFLACFQDALVVTTAPKEGQLETQLWKEIGRHWPKFHARYPQASKVKLRVRLKDGSGEQESWAILGYAVGVGKIEESAAKAQGFHAGHMLIITEETPGIHAAVMTAFRNTCTGDHNVRLALGNPDHPQDSLHTFCAERGVTAIRISALDHPNVVCGREVIPGAAGRKSIADKLAQYQSTDHPMYQSRVRGLCPISGTTPFPRAVTLRCDQPYSTELPAVWGWDFARAEDETVGIPLDAYGGITTAVQRWARVAWPEQVRRIHPLMRYQPSGKDGVPAIKIPGCGDSTGVGDPVVQMAQEGGTDLAGVVITEQVRQNLLERVQGALLECQVRGPFVKELEWLTTQLERFEYEYTARGVRYRAPDGVLDDGVFALAIAVFAYDRVRPRVPATPLPADARRDPNRWQERVGVSDRGEYDDDTGDSGGVGQLPVGF